MKNPFERLQSFRYRSERRGLISAVNDAYKARFLLDTIYERAGIDEVNADLERDFILGGIPFEHHTTRSHEFDHPGFFEYETFFWNDGEVGSKGLRIGISRAGTIHTDMTFRFNALACGLPNWIDVQRYHRQYFGMRLLEEGVESQPEFDDLTNAPLFVAVQFARAYAEPIALGFGQHL